MDYLVLAIAIAVVAAVAFVALLVRSGRRRLPAKRAGTSLRPQPGRDYPPGVGDDAEVPRDSPRPGVETIDLPPADVGDQGDGGLAVAEPAPSGLPDAAEAPVLEVPAPVAGRLVRLRARLARSQSVFGRGLLLLLSRETLDEDTWEEIEDTLLGADVGVAATQEITLSLRDRVRVLGTRTPDGLRTLLRDELLAAIGAQDRTLRTLPHEDRPAVILMVGVNGTGKTTTCGKLARVLVAEGRSVLMGAADTFRAAAADQLATWGQRVGAEVVRGAEGADPASVAFEAVSVGTERRVDVVLIDTAGRLHTKTGLMDELGKVKRVAGRQGPVDEVLLVLDATTGQNGLVQARVFAEVVEITGIVLTKLDGTAKGGIVVAVQRELGVPVKLVGLGEGPDDLAPFEPEAFVDALIGDVAEAAA